MTLQKAGGIAAIIAALSYVVGFVLLGTMLAPAGYGSAEVDPAAVLEFLLGNRGLMLAWNLTIYVLNALCLVVLAAALSQRFRAAVPGLASLTLGFGVLWATLVLGAGMVANVGLEAVAVLQAAHPEEALRLWRVLHVVETGIGGGNEIAGGVWALVLGLAGLYSRTLGRALSGLAMAIGVAGLASVLPGLGEIGGAIFGLGFIVWFAWAGVTLIWTERGAAGAPATA